MPSKTKAVMRIPTMLTAESGDVDRLGSAVRGG